MANTPFRKHKTWVHEGGISTPMIVRWPAVVKDRGALRATPGHVIDIVPTVLAAAEVTAPVEWKGAPVPVAPGKSLLPVLAGTGNVDRESLWWLHEGNRAIRVGDWKLVSAGKEGAWELYDLGKDRAETTDLAEKQPEKVKELAARWEALTAAHGEVARREAK